MFVKVINNDIESAIKKMKRMIHNDGLIKEVLRRSAYEKPSEKKRRKRQESIQKAKKEARLRASQF